MEPLASLSPSKQNVRATYQHGFEPHTSTPTKHDQTSPGKSVSVMATAPISPPDSPNQHDQTESDFHDAHSSPTRSSRPVSRHVQQGLSSTMPHSPIRYRLQDEGFEKGSPPEWPTETMRDSEGPTRAMGNAPYETSRRLTSHTNVAAYDEGMTTIYHSPAKTDVGDETQSDITLGLDRSVNDETVGDLSNFSAIPADMTKFAALRPSPTKTSKEDPWSPSKQLRNSMAANTPGQPRPLLLGRNSVDGQDDATPRKPRTSGGSSDDLMNFTGMTNVTIPPPDSAPRTQRRSPSGRGGFPIRVNPTPSQHRSQASVERERAAQAAQGTQGAPVAQSARRLPDRPVQATPAHSRSGLQNGTTGFGMDLLDIDLAPMATPRSIPTVTPRELETLRSELQSRISGLEATLSGKEAEVMALKRAITDAEIRAGKSSEELRGERSEKEQLQHHNGDLERRCREMEEVLREIKTNAFVEERERDKLRRQIEEADKLAEEREVKILELNATLETLRSERLHSPQKQSPHAPATPGGTVDVDFAVKNATETVARELHALYKSKHERKVSDLKVSYEKRWQKQVEALRAELHEAQDEIVALKTMHEQTLSGIVPPQLQERAEQISKMEGQIEELRRFSEEKTAEKKMVEAEVAGLKSNLETVRSENEALRKEVESERVEKGELVAQVEVFLQVSESQERELETHRQRESEREREIERERERERQREREREERAVRQPASPPRSDYSDTSSGNGMPPTSHRASSSISSPQKFGGKRNSLSNPPSSYNGPTSAVGNASTRPRPMSMLQKPAAGKFSGIPGASGLKPPGTKLVGAGGAARGGLMEGIARMGAGGR